MVNSNAIGIIFPNSYDGLIPELVRQTGVTACHLSGKKAVPSRMSFRREGVPMGLPGFDEFTLWQTDAGAIRAARTALDSV